MPSRVPEPRELTVDEKELIRWMLENGNDIARSCLPQLEQARVVSGCDCGCATIQLGVNGFPEPTGGLRVLGDFLYGENGSLCGAFVYEQDGVLSGLEVYSLGDENATVLPQPSDLRAFEEGEQQADVSRPHSISGRGE